MEEDEGGSRDLSSANGLLSEAPLPPCSPSSRKKIISRGAMLTQNCGDIVLVGRADSEDRYHARGRIRCHADTCPRSTGEGGEQEGEEGPPVGGSLATPAGVSRPVSPGGAGAWGDGETHGSE